VPHRGPRVLRPSLSNACPMCDVSSVSSSSQVWELEIFSGYFSSFAEQGIFIPVEDNLVLTAVGVLIITYRRHGTMISYDYQEFAIKNMLIRIAKQIINRQI
jgi:hypothetical protein